MNVMADASLRPQFAAGPMRSMAIFYILRRMASRGQDDVFYATQPSAPQCGAKQLPSATNRHERKLTGHAIDVRLPSICESRTMKLGLLTVARGSRIRSPVEYEVPSGRGVMPQLA